MHSKKLSWTLMLFVLLIGTACTKDEDTIPTPAEPEPTPQQNYEGVDEELWIYFARFEEEGRRRGLTIDLRAAKITGVIQELGEDNVAGQCNFHTFFPNHVIIDEGFWNRSSDRSREFVVFHELGHCDLGRKHREDSFSNGRCASIMRSGTGRCRDNYNSFTRNSYLDELFDPSFRNDIRSE